MGRPSIFCFKVRRPPPLQQHKLQACCCCCFCCCRWLLAAAPLAATQRANSCLCLLLFGCLCSGDSAEFAAAPPTLFELIEDERFFAGDGEDAKGSKVPLCGVAFAAEGARLLLFTEEGDLVAVGDGCVQQQLLSLHLNDQQKQQQQQQQQQQQESWKKAAATIAPRFWADKSRRQRLRGACRIHVPYRKIVKVSSSRVPCCCCCCCRCSSSVSPSFLVAAPHAKFAFLLLCICCC